MPITLENLLADSEASKVLRSVDPEEIKAFLSSRLRQPGLLKAFCVKKRRGQALGHLTNQWARRLATVLSVGDFVAFKSPTVNKEGWRAEQILCKLLDRAAVSSTLDSIIPDLRAKCAGLPEFRVREAEPVRLDLDSGLPQRRVLSTRVDVLTHALAIRLSQRYIEHISAEVHRLGKAQDCPYLAFSPDDWATSDQLAKKLYTAVPWPISQGADPVDDNGADCCESDSDEAAVFDDPVRAAEESEDPQDQEPVLVEDSVPEVEASTSTPRPAADFDWSTYKIPRRPRSASPTRQSKKQKCDELSASEVTTKLDPCVARVDRYLGTDPSPPELVTEEFKAQCKEFALIKDLAYTVKQAREDLFKVVSIQQRDAEFEALQASLKARVARFREATKHQTPSASRQLRKFVINEAFERNARWVKSGRPQH